VEGLNKFVILLGQKGENDVTSCGCIDNVCKWNVMSINKEAKEILRS